MRLFHRDVISRPSVPGGRTAVPAGPWQAGAAAIALACLPATGHALGLGRLVGEAVLGETLQFEIPLTGSVERTLDTGCITIRRPTEAIDAEYFPRDLTARIERRADGPRLLLHSPSALRQPLVEFRITVACGYNLSHDYLLMASPRSTAAAAPTAPRQVPPSAAPTAASAPAAGAATPDGVPGRTVTLEREMSLEDLARQHFPGPLRRERFMRWVAEANPALFAGITDVRRHRLAAGQALLIPQGVPPRRPGDHQMPAPASEVRPAAGEAVSPPGARAPGGPAAKGRQDRLVVGGGSGSPRDFKETLALVERLTGMLEQQVTAQAANDERIRKLEASVAELSKYVVQLETAARQREAQWQAEREAARQAQAEQATHGWWQLLLAVIAGGGLGAALLQGLRALAGRGRPAPVPEVAPVSEPASPAPDAFAPEEPAPAAVAAGWDDELAPGPVPGTVPPAIIPPPPAVAALAAMPAPARHHAPPRRSRGADLDFPIEFEPPPPPQRAPERAPEPPSVLLPPEALEATDPANAAVELANIMTSMGLAESAAQTLVEHIRDNPRESLQNWLKLLELHRLNGNREGFETSAQELRQHFNVQPEEWDSATSAAARDTIEAYPHIRSQLLKLWRRAECVNFLQMLLMDNRDGTRVGFPLPVAEEILLLIAIQSTTP